MNQKKAKALRRAAKATAAQFPVHATKTYQDIVRQTVQRVEVADKVTILGKVSRVLGRMLGKKTKPKTKEVEVVTNESRQTVLASGWRFIQQRLKAAIRRREAFINRDGEVIETSVRTTGYGGVL